MQTVCTLVLCSVNTYLKLGHPFSVHLFSPGTVTKHANAICEVFLFKGIYSALRLESIQHITSYFIGSICFIACTNNTSVIGVVKESCLNCTQAGFISFCIVGGVLEQQHCLTGLPA